MNWRAFNRLTTYLLIDGAAFAIATMKEEMSSFAWRIFALGMVGKLALTWRTFMDTSTSTKPEALPPPALSPAQPETTNQVP